MRQSSFIVVVEIYCSTAIMHLFINSSADRGSWFQNCRCLHQWWLHLFMFICVSFRCMTHVVLGKPTASTCTQQIWIRNC